MPHRDAVETAPDTTMELAELFGHVTRRLRRGTGEALAPLGLSGSQARVIRLLADAPLRMAAIADRLAVVPRSVTDMVDGVEAAGLVVRRADPDDRRSVLVELTPAGRLLLDRLDAARHQSADHVFGVLGEAQRAELLHLLRALCGQGGCPACAPRGSGGLAAATDRRAEGPETSRFAGLARREGGAGR